MKKPNKLLGFYKLSLLIEITGLKPKLAESVTDL